jgi:hypothetical protein
MVLMLFSTHSHREGFTTLITLLSPNTSGVEHQAFTVTVS